MANSSLTPEAQAALQQYGVTYDQFVFYEARRIDGRHLTQAVAVVLLYDFFLTLGEEVEYVWKTKPRISVAKTLWFLNRYWPLVSVFVRIWAMAYMFPTKLACNFAIQFTAWSGMFNIAIVDILLMLRIWALYNGSRKVMWILIAVFVIGMPAAIAIRKVPPLASIPLVVPAPQSLTICKRSPPSELFSLYTMALAIDTVLFAMLIAKAWGKDMRGQMPVLKTLVRDGALYYAAITGVLALMIAATMIPLIYQPVADSNLNIPVCSLACNRLILSLRGVYFKKHGDETTGNNLTYDAPNRPTFASRSGRDIPLDSIQVFSPRSSIPFKSMADSEADYDWDKEPSHPVTPISPRGTSRRPSKDHAYGDMHGRSPPAVRSETPVHARVTVTRTKSVVRDDGREYSVPVDHFGPRSPEQRERALEWWDSQESIKNQSRSRDLEASRNGVYESKVGYHHRIEEEEGWYEDDDRSTLKRH